jgi:hypothetical protein
MTLRAVLHEPLLHFLVLGGLLFVLYGLTPAPDQTDVRQIRVTAAQVEQLAAQFSRTWMRPPTEEELAGLIERHIRGEVFYREALAMGLDQDDPYVRNRLGQKLEFLLDDLSAETAPSDETLARYLQEHPRRYEAPARLSFQQVYLNPDRHPQLEADATRLLAQLRGGADPAALGDISLLGQTFDDLSQPEVARQFGDAFAEALLDLEQGRWLGPIPSGLGAHLVQVTDRQPARRPTLDEVRSQVLRDWQDQQRRAQKEQAYARLRQRYAITVEPAAGPETLSTSSPPDSPPDPVADAR